MELTQHQADAFARMPLTYLRQEYPNHIMHLLNDDGDVLPPRELHPIFYGCFDWHSAVHGYWLLLRCVRLYPELPCRNEIVALIDEHLTDENVAKELAYFTAPFRASFERPYGYGWLLALAHELKQSSLPQASVWYQTLEPLTRGYSQPTGGLSQQAHLSDPRRNALQHGVCPRAGAGLRPCREGQRARAGNSDGG